MKIKARMLIYGFIPFGGIHTLKFVKVEPQNHFALTSEKNSIVKIWNHKIHMIMIDQNKIEYTDEIELNAGILTNFVSKWAESLYLDRQKRWKLVVNRIKKNAQQCIL